MIETVHLFGKGSSVIGVLSRPDAETKCEIAAILLNSGLLHRIGPFRLHVLLARRLAELGLPVIRIDQSGKGDSVRRPGLSFEESLRKDLEETAEFLKQEVGAQRLVIVGLCSGADDGLYLASQCPEVSGAILLEPMALRTRRFYWRSFHPRMLRGGLWQAWAGHVRRTAHSRIITAFRREPSDNAFRGGWVRDFGNLDTTRQKYEAIISRKARLLCVFTSAARWYYNYEGQLKDCLHLEPENTQVSEVHFPNAKHTYPLWDHRQRLVQTICAWVKDEFATQLIPRSKTGQSAVAEV